MIADIRLKSIHWMLLTVLILAPTAVLAQENNPSEDQSRYRDQPEAAQAPKEEDPRPVSGMSILGNQEAPTSLVIVPWKGSEIGDSIGISTMLDDSRQPVDKEVFMRALLYYAIRSETGP